MSAATLLAGIGGLLLPFDATARPFLNSPVFEVGHNPTRIVMGDFDGDGRSDLAVANTGNTGETVTIGVLLSRGGGSYRYAGVVYSSGATDAPALVAADFNQDGRTDLVLETGCCGSFLAHVLLGQGDGTFNAVAPNLALPGPLFVAETNADGRPDLIVRSGNGATSQLRVWRGNGNGAFTALAPFVAPAGIDFGIVPIVVRDLNGDQVADVIATAVGQMASVVLIGAANGTYTVGQSIANNTPNLLAHIGDATGDGVPDYVVQVFGPAFSLRCYRGVGNGTFDAAPFWSWGSFAGMNDIVAGDLNRDGLPDLAAVGGGKVHTWVGGAGTLNYRGGLQTLNDPRQVLIGDFDGAAGGDLAIVAGMSDAVGLVLARADGGYLPPEQPGSFPVQMIGLSAVDFNGDGRSDIAALQYPTQCEEPPCSWGELHPWMALPQGGFAAGAVSILGDDPLRLLTIDYDLDGRVDVVTLNNDDGPSPIIEPGSLSFVRGRGDGTFDAPVTLPICQWPGSAAFADLDLDGDLDVAIPCIYTSTLSVLLRTPAGGYATQTPIAIGRKVNELRAADLDGDGKQDLALAIREDPNHALPGEYAWMRGHGDGTFDARIVLQQVPVTAGLALGDLDGDADADLVVADGSSPGGSVVFRNQGLGVFLPSTPYRAGRSPFSPILSDINDDGALDLIVRSDASDDLSVFPGLGNAALGPAERFHLLGCTTPTPIRFVGDSDLDLVGACTDLAFYENDDWSIPDLRLTDATHLRWDPISFVGAFDVIQGSLPLLRSTAGNFGTAVQACLLNNGATGGVDVTQTPSPGSGFFYLARAIRPNGSPGTYDGEGPRQAGPRDALIQAAAAACP